WPRAHGAWTTNATRFPRIRCRWAVAKNTLWSQAVVTPPVSD
ncbi:MAG: hypothetical protein AVDCRST_MAG86-742, partial [uncultured Truepera sp.]